MSAIKEFLPYLYGFHFTVVTAHNPLTSLKGMRDVGGRLARWLLFLQQFDFTAQYQPGSHNSVTDALSRRPPIEEQVFAAVQSITYSLCGPAAIQRSQEEDPVLSKVIESMKKNTRPPPPFARQMDKLFLDQAVLQRKFRANASETPIA